MNNFEQVDTVAHRISYALSLRGMRATELAKKTGISKSSLSQYISGFNEPKAVNIYLMANALGVTQGWLMGLDVPMEKEKVSEIEKDSIDGFVIADDVKTRLECDHALEDENKKSLELETPNKGVQKATRKKIAYNNVYNKEHYERCNVMFSPGTKNRILATGESVNSFVMRVVETELAKIEKG